MENPLEIGNTIYHTIAKHMDAQTLNYHEFIEAGNHLTEEEKTARVLEVVKDNLAVLWPLFLVAPPKR